MPKDQAVVQSFYGEPKKLKVRSVPPCDLPAYGQPSDFAAERLRQQSARAAGLADPLHDLHSYDRLSEGLAITFDGAATSTSIGPVRQDLFPPPRGDDSDNMCW